MIEPGTSYKVQEYIWWNECIIEIEPRIYLIVFSLIIIIIFINLSIFIKLLISYFFNKKK